MTEEEWNEMGIPKNGLLRTINTDNEEDILSKMIDHPPHYGGENNPYEVIKIIDAQGWGMEFSLGNALKYIMRAGKKTPDAREDLQKAIWYIQHAIKSIK